MTQRTGSSGVSHNEIPASPFSNCANGWLLGLLLVMATVLAYQPAWNGKPIWDDDGHMTRPELRSLTGLVRIWIEPGATQQYYPLVHTAFWVEYKLWGDVPLGYHLVNILLHVSAALLLLKILQTLRIPGAWLAAAIFALHPVEVESVAWISELKNTLSAVCCLGSALAYLRFDRTKSKRSYLLALLLFALGLMSKSVIATLPAALLVIFWWQRGKLSWKQDVRPLIPFFIAGIAAGLFTAWMERHFIGAQGSDFNFSIVERCLIAGRAVWFYLGKLFWPVDLIFSYPRWNVSQTVAWQYLYPAALGGLIGGLWLWRRSRGPLAAMLIFVGTLFPALGFVNVYPFVYSFVADHFQYLAGIGIIVLASAGVEIFFNSFKKRERFLKLVFCPMLLTTLCVLTWRQSRMYADAETLWQVTIDRNPQCWLAYNDLGNLFLLKSQPDTAVTLFQKALAVHPQDSAAYNNLGTAMIQKGDVDKAIDYYQQALTFDPNYAEAYDNLGGALLKKGRMDEAMTDYRRALQLDPKDADAYNNLGAALLQNGQIDEAMADCQKALQLKPDLAHAHNNLGMALFRKGQADEAMVQFQMALAIQPDFAEANNGLGNLLFQKRELDQAIAHYQAALAAKPDYLEACDNLGQALLQKGRVDEALAYFQKALQIKPDDTMSHDLLATALLQQGRLNEAVLQLEAALAIQPEDAGARNNLLHIARMLATSTDDAVRNGGKAVELAGQLDKLSGGTNAVVAATLAAAYAEAGRFDEAVTNVQRAIELAGAQGNTRLVNALQGHLKLYQNHTPLHENIPGQ